MNRDQAKGAIKGTVGKAQAEAGRATSNQDREAKGILKENQGRMQKAYCDLKEALRNSRHS